MQRVATLRIKQYGQYRLSGESITYRESSNLKPNSKSLKILSKTLGRSPSVKKNQRQKSRWTVPLTSEM